MLLLAVATFIVLLLPWRLYTFKYLHSFSWQHSNSTWVQFWTPDSALPPYFPTINVACHLEPKICDILYQNNIKKDNVNTKFYYGLTLMTFMRHPFGWYAEKAKYFNIFWFGGSFYTYSWHDLLAQSKGVFIEGVLAIVAGFTTILAMYFMWRRENSPEFKGLFLFSLLFLIYNFMLFSLLHYEPRYSLFLRLYFIYLPVWFFGAFENYPVLDIARVRWLKSQSARSTKSYPEN
jgi:hypothetical protein